MKSRELLLQDLANAKKEVRSLGKALHRSGNDLQRLIAWLRVKKPEIYEEYKDFEKKVLSKINSNDRKNQSSEITLLKKD